MVTSSHCHITWWPRLPGQGIRQDITPSKPMKPTTFPASFLKFLNSVVSDHIWKTHTDTYTHIYETYTHIQNFFFIHWIIYAAAAAKSLQSCLTLCNPIDGSPPGSAIPGILQARTLEWAAISFSNAWKWKVKVKSLCRLRLFATPWTAAYQAPPSMGFSRQEYWSGVPSACFKT